MVEAGKGSKEAEAVVRGGMTICETKGDGTRKYIWIRVEPTLTDAESSIKLAMDKHEKKKQVKRKPNPIEPVVEEKASVPTQTEEMQVVKKEIDSFIIRLKKKAKKIWEEIDSVVIE